MNPPKVSVIIPVYNVKQYLQECLDCVVNQTLRDIEIICVDDGSTDGSYELLREYESKDPRVTVLRQENAGAGAARNTGLAVAKGEYLSFLDADDFFELDMLEKAYQKASSLDVDIIVYGNDKYMEQDHEFVARNAFNRKLLPKQECFAATDIEKNLFRAVIGWTWDKLFKRTFIEECGLRFQQIRVHNDLLFTFAAWATARRITVMSDVLTHQRKRGGGSISDEFREWWCTFDALNGLKEYLQTHGLMERFQQDYINYVVYLFMFNLDRVASEAREQYCKLLRDEWLLKLGFYEAKDEVFYNQAELQKCNRILYANTTELAPVDRSGDDAGRVKVSVVLPVLNSVRYIDECVVSILNQTLREIELICIDAGSTDGTLERLEYYAGADPRVRIIPSDKKSFGYQVNLGMDAAQGEYIGIVESDDYILEDMYQTLYGLAEEHGLDAVKCDFCRFYGEPAERKFAHAQMAPDRALYDQVLNPSDDVSLFKTYNLNQPGIYATELIRRHQIRLVETPGASYQDNTFWFQIFIYSQRMLFYPKPFYMLRRDNANSSMASKGKVFCMCDVFDYIRDVIYRSHDEAFIKKYAPICARYRFSNYEFTSNRVGDEYKLAFIYKYSFDFNKLAQYGELDQAYFTDKQWERVQLIMRNPLQYYCNRFAKSGVDLHRLESAKRSLETAGEELKAARKELRSIHNKMKKNEAASHSWSYRIKRFITWGPRKVRGFFRCLKEHGAGYTARRVLVHLHLAKDGKKGK